MISKYSLLLTLSLRLNGVPNSGEIFMQTENEKEARQISEAFITRGKEKLIADTKSRMSLDDLFNKMQEGNLKDLNLIIKAALMSHLVRCFYMYINKIIVFLG